MGLVDPSKVSLQPGQGMEALFEPGPGSPEEVGLFFRSLQGIVPQNGDLTIVQRAGVVRFNDILLVVTMIKLESTEPEFFDIWWDYHSQSGARHFRKMAEQDRLTLHFYDSEGIGSSVDRDNGFQKFFSNLPGILKEVDPWTEIEFDRAVRGFCAEAYPKENLWDMIDLRPDFGETIEGAHDSLADYMAKVPENLHPFYEYVSDKGHCIRVIPSAFEEEAAEGDPSEFLHPAPVKTVLRCGVRWVNGFPVVPVPFIPGVGLAVPPDDSEF